MIVLYYNRSTFVAYGLPLWCLRKRL